MDFFNSIQSYSTGVISKFTNNFLKFPDVSPFKSSTNSLKVTNFKMNSLESIIIFSNYYFSKHGFIHVFNLHTLLIAAIAHNFNNNIFFCALKFMIENSVVAFKQI